MALGTPEIVKRGPYVVKATNRTIQVVYRVESTDGSEDDTEVLALAGIPQVSDAYQGRNGVVDLALRVREITIIRESRGPKLFLVQVNYDTAWGGINQEPPPDNPLDRPIKTRFFATNYTEVRHADVNLTQYQSSAGEPYEPGIAIPLDEIVVQISKNMPDFNAATAARFINTVNSAVFTLPTGEQIGVELARIADITGDEAFEFDVHYWAVSVTIHIRRSPGQISASRSATGVAFTPSPWDRIEADRGMYQIVSNERKLLLDANKTPLTAPAYLNGSGVVLAPGALCKFQQYQPHSRDDFNDLDFIT